MLSTAPPARVKAPPVLVPPPPSVRDPPWTSTVPVLFRAIPNEDEPAPVLRTSPSLLNRAAVAKKLPTDAVPGSSNDEPGRLFQTEESAKVIELFAATAAAPWFSTVRPFSCEKNPPVRLDGPLRTVRPVPLMVPLLQVSEPFTVTSAGPESVPPERTRFCAVTAALAVIV